jgi:hypothetical protein
LQPSATPLKRGVIKSQENNISLGHLPVHILVDGRRGPQGERGQQGGRQQEKGHQASAPCSVKGKGGYLGLFVSVLVTLRTVAAIQTVLKSEGLFVCLFVC